MNIGLVWFRQDLRLADNPALSAACNACDAVVCLFIDDPVNQTVSQVGAASRVWLHHSLHDLSESLSARGNELVLASGDSESILRQAIAHFGITRLYWNRCYDPVSIQRDKKIKQSFADLLPESFNALLNAEPWETLKGDGTPYRVYTPFWRMRMKDLPGDKPIAAPRSVPAIEQSATSSAANSAKTSTKTSTKTSATTQSAKKVSGFSPLSINDLALLPKRDWHIDMMSHWQVGEKAALKMLKRFLKAPVNDYNDARNIPSVSGTSRMSPHLHFGEISPRQILHQLTGGMDDLSRLNTDEETYAKEILWREFAYSLLFHFPHTIDKPLDKRFENFPWGKRYTKFLKAWQRGNTGVPIIDAGMRELYATGWMHNRVRMIVASYLIKNLLIPWQEGERWFRDTLVDADLASNAMGWQWAAGSGADAAPYFRVFNPVLQGEKFDKTGEYVRLWVPEIAGMPNKFIHKPWELEPIERAQFDYPEPLVDLKESRQRALAAFDTIKTPL